MLDKDESLAEPPANEFVRAKFNGSASEYFGIWIVNVLLKIITLGIYSPWAKVRRNRYFYGNTVLLDGAFEYHATGKQILIGRAIVFTSMLVLGTITKLDPILSLFSSLLILIALPWLVMRGLRFNARVTSYRNVRFDFVGGAGGAFVAVLLGGLMAIISLGTLAPIVTRWRARYVLNNLRFGDRPLHADPDIKALYKALVIPALIVCPSAVLAAFIGFNMADSITSLFAALDGPSAVTFIVLVYFVAFAIFIVYGLAALIYRAAAHNIVWSSIRIDGRHELKSDLHRGRYAWIGLSNLLVTICTLGLMRPWADVRHARYIIEHTAIRIEGEIDEIKSALTASGTAAGSEYMSVEGIDFGF
jgi:uncharacterized membrane protein YjgN (DUF898 family)